MPRAPERGPRGAHLAAAAILAAAALSSSTARAQATLSSAGHDGLEHRIVVALAPTRTTVWTAIHASAEAGAFALIVPVESGAALDLATPAWIEALEAATAPRILPPSGVEARCPGDEGPSPLHVAGDLAHHEPLVPLAIDELTGAGDVLLWAAERDLDVPSEVAQAFADSPADRFVALRFAVPAGDAWTPTLRVTFPGLATTLPWSLAHAGRVELRTTLFTFAEGRAALPGAEVTIDPATLAFDASSRTSDYADARAAALGPPGSWLVESAGHDSLTTPTSLGGGASLPALTAEYFLRASTYGAATLDPTTCATSALSAIAAAGPIALACPRADLGTVDGGPPCVEDPAPGEIDPAVLRCGGDADDLALALSGLRGPEVWLTRIAVRTASGTSGEDVEVSTTDGPEVEPVLEAGSVDLSHCGDGGAGGAGAGPSGGGGQNGAGPSGSGPSGSGNPSGGAGTPGTSSGQVAYVEVPVQVYDVTCGCGGDYVIVDYVEVPEDEAPEDGSYYAQDGDDCEGESSDTYESSDVESAPTAEDDCGGETSDTAASDDGCGSDTSETGATDSGCGSETGGTSTGDDGGSDDGGDGSSDDSGCDCGDESLAAAARRAQPEARATLRARPKLSVMALGLALVVAPLRRLTRRRRRDAA